MASSVQLNSAFAKPGSHPSGLPALLSSATASALSQMVHTRKNVLLSVCHRNLKYACKVELWLRSKACRLCTHIEEKFQTGISSTEGIALSVTRPTFPAY